MNDMEKTIVDESYNIKEIEVDNSWLRDFDKDYFEYRRKWDIASQGTGYLSDIPLFLEVEASYSCNYFCPRCPRQVLGHEGRTGFLSDELFGILFQEVNKYRIPSINLSHGGESLLRKDLPELIRKSRDNGVLDIMIHTNGSLLNKQLSIDLIQSGLTKINFSLDAASPQVYGKLRSEGKYEKVISNINDFIEVRNKIGRSYPRIRLSFVVCDENKHEQETFYELWKDKVNVIAFQQFYDFSKGKDSDGVNLSNLGCVPYCCGQLWQLLAISCDGDILPCLHDYEHENVLGNLKTHSLYECWHSEKMNRYRELHIKNRWHEIPMCCRCVNSVERVAQK